MLSKSSAFALLYVALATVLVGLFATGQADASLQAMGFPTGLADVFVCMVLVAGGLVLAIMGGDALVIASVGTVAAFVALTLHQQPLVRYTTLAAVLFAIGLYGMLASRNAVRVLISIELMLNAVNINLIAFSHYIDPTMLRGQLFAIFILTVAAAEAAVGLAIVLAIYRTTSTVDMERFNLLKW